MVLSRMSLTHTHQVHLDDRIDAFLNVRLKPLQAFFDLLSQHFLTFTAGATQLLLDPLAEFLVELLAQALLDLISIDCRHGRCDRLVSLQTT